MSQYAATCPLQKKTQKNRCREGKKEKEDVRRRQELHSLCSKGWNLNFHRPDDIFLVVQVSSFGTCDMWGVKKKLWGRVPGCTLKIRDFSKGTFPGTCRPSFDRPAFLDYGTISTVTEVSSPYSCFCLSVRAQRCHVGSTVFTKKTSVEVLPSLNSSTKHQTHKTFEARYFWHLESWNSSI